MTRSGSFIAAVGLSGLLILVSAASQPFSGGAPASRTGAPGDVGTCAAAGCHGEFPLNGGNGSVTINAPNEYEPDQTIELTVTTADPEAVSFGFEITAKDDAANIVGTWVLVDPGTRFAGGGTDYVTHNSAPPSSGNKMWSARWIAPPVSVGNVHFYAAGNGANGNGATDGDQIYTTEFTLSPANPTAVEKDAVPLAFRVTDVFPNPFVESATISFDLSRASEVSLRIYDVSGRVLISKSLGSFAAGRHQTILNAGKLPAGVLVYRLTSDTGDATGRIVFLR